MRLSICAAAAILLLMPSAASADWEYARWGMGPNEVIAASGGEAAGVRGGPGERVFDLEYRAVAAHRAMDVDVEARFFFTQGSARLAAVKLIPADAAQCDALHRGVEARHGSGSEQNFGFGTSWRWQNDGNGNQLLFADIKPVGTIPRICHLIYRPVASGAAI